MSNAQKFGGMWTKRKLDALDGYLAAYMKIMKNKGFRLIYLDTFAGEGEIEINDGNVIDGSANIASKYPFDQFLFIEQDYKKIEKLKESLKNSKYFNRMKFIRGDCNQALESFAGVDLYSKFYRGVAFIDPFSTQLKWESLETIAKTGIFDVWLFFPFMAANRILPKNKNELEDGKRKILTGIFGTESWEEELYKISDQLSLFDDFEEKVNTEEFKDYVIKRLETIFPCVSPEAAVMKNIKKSPLFLLCFAVSNSSERAHRPALNVANDLLKKIKGEN